MEHATSKGGNTTVEKLQIHKGYWRATLTSRDIYKCFNTKACMGGLTGASNYCLPGYEGPCEHGSRRTPLDSIIVCMTSTASEQLAIYLLYLSRRQDESEG